MRVPIIVWSILLAAFLLVTLLNTCQAAELNMAMDYGWPITDAKVTNSTIEITVSTELNDRLRIGLETDLSHLAFGKEYNNADATAISFSPVLRYDFFQFGNTAIYGMGGFGVGFANGSPSENALGHNPLGVIKAGIGADVWVTNKIKVELGLKYTHLSSHNPGDKGLNFAGPKFGATWRW